ncbi:MAG: hypothetical protein ACE366_01930 [Bradymonadia bacterium]
MRITTALLCTLPLLGCDLLETDDADAGASGEGGATGGGGGSGGLSPGPAGEWVITPTHPCPGRVTHALHCEDDGTCWVGCGTGAEGRGLFTTTDQGDTWSAVESDPAGFFEGSRVTDVTRSADGLLYVAGEHDNDLRVVSLNDAGEIGEVFRRGATTDFSFTPGSFRRNADGRAIAESLTGTDLVYRDGDGEDPDPNSSWQSGRGFWSDTVPNGVQILDLQLHDDAFYAVGSTIAQPPMVFLPSWDDTFGFDIVQLANEGPGAFTGELWGVAADDAGVVAGGVNQSRDVGVIFTLSFGEGLEPTDPASWQMTDLSEAFADSPAWTDASTWVEGVCKGPGVIYAVGRESRRNFGFVIQSTDGGATWADVSVYGDDASRTAMPPLDRCVVVDGTVYLAGNDGFFARSK